MLILTASGPAAAIILRRFGSPAWAVVAVRQLFKNALAGMHPQRVPGGRDDCRAPTIARDRARTRIRVCKHTNPGSLKRVETDCVLLLSRNTDRYPPLVGPSPPQLEHT